MNIAQTELSFASKSLSGRYAELLFQMSLGRELIAKDIALSILEKFGAIDDSLASKTLIAVYSKDDSDDNLIFMEDAEAYYWLDSFIDEQPMLNMFGVKVRNTREEVDEYIVEIVNQGGYKLNELQTLHLWLQLNHDSALSLGENRFYLENGLVTGTNPYGCDEAVTSQKLTSWFQTNAIQILGWLKYWEEPRDERGSLLQI